MPNAKTTDETNVVAEFLTAKDMRQTEFAKAVGVYQSMVSQWVRGSPISVEAAKRMAAAFPVDLPLHRVRPDIWPVPVPVPNTTHAA